MKKQEKAKAYFLRYWQLYAMLIIPLLYFLLFKYVPLFGNVLAFRRYRPGMGPFGTEWVGLHYFSGSGAIRRSGGRFETRWY